MFETVFLLAQADLELNLLCKVVAILLFQSPGCWDYRCGPPHLSWN